uniref:DNA polymerase type B n=1 Tax=Clavaria fumosa TaxID=264083 RepID=A0A7T3U4V8_9AGAR|nr:DNA polymerase type B [Clavaria fumosa]QPZ51100.1 DNA polymerase type B [Clavaria fumosa]
MDTDSIVVNKEIPKKFIRNDLGMFKKVCDILEGIFVAPKLYYLKTKNESTITEIRKAKGIGDDLSRNDYINLLKNKEIIINKERWFLSKSEGTIQSKNIKIKNNSIKK